jgi:hypothetical protein
MVFRARAAGRDRASDLRQWFSLYDFDSRGARVQCGNDLMLEKHDRVAEGGLLFHTSARQRARTLRIVRESPDELAPREQQHFAPAGLIVDAYTDFWERGHARIPRDVPLDLPTLGYEHESSRGVVPRVRNARCD